MMKDDFNDSINNEMGKEEEENADIPDEDYYNSPRKGIKVVPPLDNEFNVFTKPIGVSNKR